MSLHESTFSYIEPTERQKARMTVMRRRAAEFAQSVDDALPDGPDKTYVLRKFREVAMWCNIAITRQPDGSPRQDVPLKAEKDRIDDGFEGQNF